jgi:hypothetical protein
MLKEPHEDSFGILADPSPRRPFHRGTSSRREPEHPRKAPFCFHAESIMGPVPKEYQGSYERGMAANHAPWKGNQWPGLPDPGRQSPSSLAPARDSRKEHDIRLVPEEDPPPLASILLAPDT